MPAYPGHFARAFETPLMVHPGKAVAMIEGLGSRLIGQSVIVEGPARLDHAAHHRPFAGILGDPLKVHVDDRQALTRFGPVAVITIEGTLVHKGKYVGAESGETSYEGIQRQVSAARTDPSVRGVVFEVDSCGGEVAGSFDCAESIAELSAEKPTMAILTDHSYSAAYLLASAARGIIVPKSGGAGSIGVCTMHADFSKFLAKEGIKVTVISAGDHKSDGSPYSPLPADVLEKWESECQRLRVQFAETVGRYRGARFTEADALATEADCYLGEDAVSVGLADDIGRPTEAFSAFVDEVQSNTN